MRRRNLAPLILAAFCVLSLVGCSSTRKLVESLPDGAAIQYSLTGIQFTPESLSPLNLGTTTLSITLPQPDGSPGLNRYNLRASLAGVESTSTVATGPIGDQIEAAGGPEALEALLRSRVAAPSLPGTNGPAGSLDFLPPITRDDSPE